MNINHLRGKTVGAAVSGGLDSCTITRWLVENGVNVFCLTADLGQPDEVNIEDIRTRMLACGAEDAIYWNTTGIARHVTVAALLPEMEKRGIDILLHGATGRGNDQARFQLITNMMNPAIHVYAPWRDPLIWEMFPNPKETDFPGRTEMIDYCNSRNLPITASHDKPYSTDANLLGLTHEAGSLESLNVGATFITPGMGVHPQDAPDAMEEFTVRFEQGMPVEINGQRVSPLEALLQTNEIGGRNGVGIGLHTVENRFVGIKSRGVYEAPGMAVLGQCYEYMLQLMLDRRARRAFDNASQNIAEQIYQGYWFDPATDALRATVDSFTKLMTATVTVGLYKGNISFQSVADGSAPHSLYSEETASMEAIGEFNHDDSEGFLAVLGVSAKALNVTGQVKF